MDNQGLMDEMREDYVLNLEDKLFLGASFLAWSYAAIAFGLYLDRYTIAFAAILASLNILFAMRPKVDN
ncbi:MAG TPA: hypothetical protein VGF97_10385 [Rhizomicrobium sp.]